MYESFFKLKEKPFNLTPDPRFIYFTERHCEALANLVYGIRERKGFMVLSGEVGTGKTTLVNALLDTLDRTGVMTAFIFNPILTSSEFFEYLLADFNIKYNGSSKTQALIKLNSLLLERYRTGQVTVLVVDEAQNLSAEILEEIRLLTNLETATEKLLQIVLVGQPELSLKLNSSELRQLKQRINLRCNLEPLSLAETRDYIKTRLEIAGLPDQQIFPSSVITEIYRFSSGIPRLINTISDNALLTSYACDCDQVTTEIIMEVVEDLELSEGYRHVSRRREAGKRLDTSTVPSGIREEPLAMEKFQSSDQEVQKADSQSFELFVQYVDKLKNRTH
ncbi:MAG: AAA family ATPase [Terriglobia bacterium]